MVEGIPFAINNNDKDASSVAIQQRDTSNRKRERLHSLHMVTILMMIFSFLSYTNEFSSIKYYAKGMYDTTTKTTSSTEGRVLHDSSSTSSWIPLPELVRASEQVTCPEGLFAVEQVVNPKADRGLGINKIPKIIHQTGEGKCLTEPFYKNAQKWSFANHSFYFHDKKARQRLFDKYWPLFPQFQNSLECVKNAGGAAVADVWRYLALWEYGGVYTDMDNAPAKLFNASTLTPDIDAFFLVERTGILSQYFFAVSPQHPIMFLAIHDMMEKIHAIADTGTFYVPRTTGPKVIKDAFIKFMGGNEHKYGKPKAGTYYGVALHNGNRSVTVEANTTTQDHWVLRDALKRKVKGDGWEQMNFTNYQKMNKVPSNKTCLQLIMEHHLSTTGEDYMKEFHRRRW